MLKLIRKYEACWGLSLPAIGNTKIEFWFAPRGYQIKPHTHPNQDIKLTFLLGHNVLFGRNRKQKTKAWVDKNTGQVLVQSEDNIQTHLAKWWQFGKTFNILAGDIHWFNVSKFPLLFMNIEKWKHKPTSASEDLVYA